MSTPTKRKKKQAGLEKVMCVQKCDLEYRHLSDVQYIGKLRLDNSFI